MSIYVKLNVLPIIESIWFSFTWQFFIGTGKSYYYFGGGYLPREITPGPNLIIIIIYSIVL